MSDTDYISPTQPVPPSELILTLDSGIKVKRRIPRMRGCDEVNAKGKGCHGHLKKVPKAPAELVGQFGSEIYRCEKCHTWYLPNEQEKPRSRAQAW